MISSSIVLYNTNTDQLKKIINSYSPAENKKLYLIDNSPIKTNMDIDTDNVLYHYVGKNIGYGSGHNIAIKKAIEAGSKYHIILNPDLQFNPEIINNIIQFMDNDLSIAQLMPKIVDINGYTQYLCKLLPSPVVLFLRRFIPNFILFNKLLKKYELQEFGYDRIINPPCLSGCFMFLRVETLKNNNLMFDEQFFMYCEDFDLTRRIHKVAKTIYYPFVTVIHEHAKESYKSKKMMFIHIKSVIKYFNKWGWFFDKERKEMNNKILQEINLPT